jgi:chemotaxis protein methyltransferase CheR
MTAADPQHLERFRTGVARWLGLQFDEGKSAILHDALVRRLKETGLGGAAYLERLERPEAPRVELRALARELTVGETYFYRNVAQFSALAEVALPARMAERARSHTRALSLLSAGCASGEEPYSLAMAVRQHITEPDWKVSIVGVDINPAALEKAAAGRYSTWSLRELPVDARRRWFHDHGREVEVVGAIREAVRFEEHNLADDGPVLWSPGSYDVVFCRNVLMYFTPEGARALARRLARALVPGGYLFLGHAETLRGVSNDFHLCHTHGTFYYQRKKTLASDDADAQPGPAAPSTLVAVPLSEASAISRRLPDSPALSPSGPWSVEWIEAIRSSSERIATLAAAAPLAPESSVRPETSGPDAQAKRPELREALAFVAQEQYREALALLRQLPEDAANDLDVLLLSAVLLTHRGSLIEAEAACMRILEADVLNASAHYLLALCRESAGDRRGALEHDQTAAYLDPTFAMPHLHAGMLARRQDDHETARRELGQALPLLLREEAPRLSMFGGGFTRQALVALCRTELAAAGGSP